ncbi:hypothetical protein GCM10010521_59890 [Streptomyces rameus]|uniref:Uncharacterized protein n=1 Tax=Streptomyces rameus TaxID=68261 RepID=A0ABN3V1A5_9ACTN
MYPSLKIRYSYSTWSTSPSCSVRSTGGGMPKGPRGLDPAFGAAAPLGQGGLGHEVGAGDLDGGQAAHGPQRQGDPRGRGQLGVAAQEAQREGVVVGGGAVLPRRRYEELVAQGQPGGGLLAPPGVLAAQSVSATTRTRMMRRAPGQGTHTCIACAGSSGSGAPIWSTSPMVAANQAKS